MSRFCERTRAEHMIFECSTPSKSDLETSEWEAVGVTSNLNPLAVPTADLFDRIRMIQNDGDLPDDHGHEQLTVSDVKKVIESLGGLVCRLLDRLTQHSALRSRKTTLRPHMGS